MRADDFLTEGGLVSFLKKFGADAVDYAAGKAPKVKNWVDTNPQGGLLGGRVPGKPDDVTHVYRNMSPEELEAAKKSGYFDKNPNPDPNIKWDTDKKYWSQGDAEDYFGRAWKDSPDNAKVRMPAEKLPRWTAGQTSNAEVLDKSTGAWNPVKENFADGKNPGRKGLAKRMGVNTKASVSSLRKTAKNSSGEKQRMAHWLANMKSGRNKNK